ncbi:hypothetical protein OUZ56_008530 [Daphnia magna]|uniref:Uncharacterized protein n=1 Tax=Daphnia magna TaxID=35525 RepID=A0ABR0AD85_9CRUS|nr:hypothetical protein OUZ56_008530 [Daphnia magna]
MQPSIKIKSLDKDKCAQPPAIHVSVDVDNITPQSANTSSKMENILYSCIVAMNAAMYTTQSCLVLIRLLQAYSRSVRVGAHLIFVERPVDQDLYVTHVSAEARAHGCLV